MIPLILYFDLDGVLADFNKKCVEILGHKFDETQAKHCWKTIARYEDFWESLEPFDGLIDFLFFLNNLQEEHVDLQYKILSGTPTSNTHESEVQKIKWVRKHLGPVFTVENIHLCRAKTKQCYSNIYSILIDDRVQNIEQWVNNGGIGILHDTETEGYETLKTKLIDVLKDVGYV